MQATPGAIDAVDINGRHEVVRLSVIGNSDQPDIRPLGICGTGAINTIAQLFTKGIIKGNGAFASGDPLFSLVKGNSSGNQPPVFISQKDIRSVQLGKAALITGIELLLTEAGINTPEQILVAGAFGNYLKKEDIIRLGMVPSICANRIEMIGNSAGAGAVMVLCDDSYLQKTIDEAEKVSAIDLAGKTEFQKRFIGNLEFPEQVNPETQS